MGHCDTAFAEWDYEKGAAFVIDRLGHQSVIPSHFNKNEVFASLQKRLEQGHSQISSLRASSESQCILLNIQLQGLEEITSSKSFQGENKKTRNSISPIILTQAQQALDQEVESKHSSQISAEFQGLDREVQPYWSAIISKLKSQITIDVKHL